MARRRIGHESFGFERRAERRSALDDFTGMPDWSETLPQLDAWNAQSHRIRGRVEKVFDTWKRSDGVRRMRWIAPAKATLQVLLTAIA